MPSKRRAIKKKGPNGKGKPRSKLSTMLLVVLALVGCVFSIGVLLGALALNQDQGTTYDKLSYRDRTNGGGDPAAQIGRTVPHLPGAQENGVGPINIPPPPPPPPPPPRDLNRVDNPNKPVTKLLSSKVDTVAVIKHPAEVDLSSPVVDPQAAAVDAAAAAGGDAAAAAAAAAATPPVVLPSSAAVPHKVHRDFSLLLDGENWMDVKDTLDSSSTQSTGVDLAVTAWIWLDPKDQGDHMKTVFANRVAGCDVSSDRIGVALYVNTWQTRDRALKLDLGTASQGCVSLATGGNVIPYGKWTHVGLLMEQQHDDPDATMVMLSVNGEILISKSMRRGESRSHQQFRIGAHVDGQAPFVGNVSELFVWEKPITDINSGRRKLDRQFYDQIPSLTGKESGLRAYFPLDWYDGKTRKDFSVGVDLGKNQ